MPTRLVAQVALAVATVAAVAGAVFLIARASTSGRGIEIVPPTAPPVAEAELTVYVIGAVKNPGVYTVREGDRLIRVLEAAGGADSEADLDAVNLAARVRDEDHWHIPRIGEEPPFTAGNSPGAPGKIDVNSATEEMLRTLPGIGEVKAKAIVAHREANGRFSDVEGLLGVTGIGPATLAAIKDLVVAY